MGQRKAFPWRGRCHGPLPVTDEVEGNSVIPTYGDNRSLRPHQSQLTLRQLPLQGKPYASPFLRMEFGGRGMPRPYGATPEGVQKFGSVHPLSHT